MALPATGWMPYGTTRGAPTLDVPLPVPCEATYRDGGGAIVTPIGAVAVVARVSGNGEVVGAIGLDADGAAVLVATLRQTGVFAAVLLDALTPPAAWVPCGPAPAMLWTACGDPPATAWAGCGARPVSAWAQGGPAPATAWEAD